MTWTNIRRNLKQTTRTLLSAKKATNKSLTLGKTRSVYGSEVTAKRKEHADSLRSLKKKMGSKPYREHRIAAAKSSFALKKNK